MALSIYKYNTKVDTRPPNFDYIKNMGRNNTYNYNSNLSKNVMRKFFNANPDLEEDRMTFTLLNMSGALLPVIGTVGAFTTMWSKNMFTRAFKSKYLKLINGDKDLVGLINGLGIKTSNLNGNTLKSIASMARAQNATNNRTMAVYNDMMMRVNNNRRRNVTDLVLEAKTARMRSFVIYALIFRSFAMLVVMIKALSYMVMVTNALTTESTVDTDNFYRIVNIVARFVYVMSNVMVPVVLAGCEHIFSQFAKFLSGTNTGMIDLSVGLVSTAAVKMALDKNMLTLLTGAVNGLVITLDSVLIKKNSNMFVRLAAYFLPGIQDQTVTHVNKVFQTLRNFLTGASNKLMVIMATAAFYSLASTVSTIKSRKTANLARPSIRANNSRTGRLNR